MRLLGDRLYTDTARELWNDITFIEKRIEEQKKYIAGESRADKIADAQFILNRFAQRHYILTHIGCGNWRRASGEVNCSVCGKQCNRHPNVEGYEWLTVLCDGSLVKL